MSRACIKIKNRFTNELCQTKKQFLKTLLKKKRQKALIELSNENDLRMSANQLTEERKN